MGTYPLLPAFFSSENLLHTKNNNGYKLIQRERKTFSHPAINDI